MVLSDEGEDQLHKKLLDLCGKLSLDENTTSLAWDNFISINKKFTLEGDSLHWLGCAVFVASQSVEVPNLMSSVVRGSGINLTSLLRCSNLSFVQFFTNIKLWAEMARLPETFRQKVKHLQDTFGVAHSTFKKYYPIFCQIFVSPNSADLEGFKQHKRKFKPIMCNSSTVFEFIWNLFVTLKSEDPQFGTELVKSYHLLFACVDLAFKNAFLAERRDLIKPNFELLPPDWNIPGFEPQEAPCLINYLCKLPTMLTEAMHMKVYDLKKLMGNLITNNVLTADPKSFTGLFDQENFKENFKNIKNAYETHLLNTADIDERIFLAEYRRLLIVQQQQAAWGQSVRASPLSYSGENSVITSPQKSDNNGVVTSSAPDTPLTGRGYLPRESDSSPLSADRTISQKIARLHKIVNNRPQGASEALLKLLNTSGENTIEKIQEILNNLSERFLIAYSSKYNSGEEEAKTMLQIGVTLFYKYVGDILENESKIRHDISALLKKDMFYKCMFCCCMEIVLFSYNFPSKFPWILDVCEVQPLHFVKVIELIIRTKDQLSREIVKHLNMTEETVLESLMWKSNSPIWEAIELSGESVPKFEETALPGQVVYDRNGVKNEPNEHTSVLNMQSPLPSAVDRFQSPIKNASRNLFSNIQPGQSVLQKNPHIIITDKAGNKTWISVADVDRQQPAPESMSNVRRRLGSLAIILRKFYVLAGIRMEHLCMKLNLVDTEVKKKIWTQFEYSIQNSDLIRDRHLDQLLMCAVYVISRLSDVPLKFQDIMRYYREQPQCNSNVYRNVLITRESLDESGNRIPEKRSDLIIFYNSVYVGVMQKFAVKFRSSVQTNNLLLSPLPAVKSKSLISSSVQVVGNVFLRPFEMPVASSSTNFNYFFSRSPSKDLKDINKLVNNSKVTGKRLLADDLEAEVPAKRLSDHKFHTLVEERRNQNSE